MRGDTENALIDLVRKAIARKRGIGVAGSSTELAQAQGEELREMVDQLNRLVEFYGPPEQIDALAATIAARSLEIAGMIGRITRNREEHNEGPG